MLGLTDRLIDYECGVLSSDEIIDLFQTMIDKDYIKHFQGHYGRMANELIKTGHCHK